MAYRGGYGVIAHGRSQFGAAASGIEPRFKRVSSPYDGQIKVPRPFIWPTFEIYFFSSSFDFHEGPPEGFDFEVSENGGTDFLSVFDLASPYSIDWRLKDGQTVWVKIQKLTGKWPEGSEIIIRSTMHDEFGQEVTKEVPVLWTDPDSFPYGPGAP